MFQQLAVYHLCVVQTPDCRPRCSKALIYLRHSVPPIIQPSDLTHHAVLFWQTEIQWSFGGGNMLLCSPHTFAVTR